MYVKLYLIKVTLRRNLNEYKAIAVNFQRYSKHHFSALQNLLMASADLSDYIKDWGCVKKSSVSTTFI